MHKFYAHSVDGTPDEWHLLEEHEGTVPDLRTDRSGVVESGLSPAKTKKEWAIKDKNFFGAFNTLICKGCFIMSEGRQIKICSKIVIMKEIFYNVRK